ncbi:MAG: DUF2892 domain-containing protein [Candidatus Moranbacteria bacterium]|nr:DUF2892 domain-containing protein [Candidatus Moranbacteria bacterium]
MKIIKNEGIVDRVTRGVIGSNFVIFAFFQLEGIALLLTLLLGAILISSAVTGYCMLYKTCGINTKKDWE